MDTREIIEGLRALPLHRRYSVALAAGVIGQCCPDCGCYAGTCHEWSWKDSGQDCTCSENPANAGPCFDCADNVPAGLNYGTDDNAVLCADGCTDHNHGKCRHCGVRLSDHWPAWSFDGRVWLCESCYSTVRDTVDTAVDAQNR